MTTIAVPAAGLDRLVHRLDDRPALDEHGFLRAGAAREPEESGLRKLSDLASAPHGFVLLGAGGLGKTTALNAVASWRPVPGGVANAMVLDRHDLTALLQASAGQTDPVYLDALDQAAIADMTFMTRLEHVLKHNGACIPRLRLACRPAAWRASLVAVLRDVDPNFTEYMLAPLDRATAETVVGAVLGDREHGIAFVESLVRAGLGGLAATVGQMLTVARSWKDTGVIDSVGSAMASEVDKLLIETNPDVQGRLSRPRRLLVARRLAAFAAFGGQRVLSVLPGVSTVPGLELAGLPDDPEPGGPPDSIEPKDYLDVAGTSLFEPVAAGAVGFRHQRYLDYLAGTYIAKRAASPSQIRALLCDLETGTIAPSLVGAAAWIASEEPDLVADLVEANAAAFASAASDAELHAPIRAAVIDTLLGTSVSPVADPGWGIIPAALRHPDLTHQLMTAAARDDNPPEALWWICRFAAATPDLALAPDLQRVAADATLPGYPRRAAIAALGALGDIDACRPIRDLLTAENDDDNEVLAAAIDVLYPDLLTTEDMLGVLRPPQVGMIGGYQQILGEFASRIPDSDLIMVLHRLAGPEFENMNATLEPLLAGVVSRAWQRRADPAVLDALASTLHTLSLGHHEFMISRRRFPWVETNETGRRDLILALGRSPQAGPTTRYAIDRLNLFGPDDAHWLLDTLPGLPPAQATALAPTIRTVIHSADFALADRILSLTSGHPAYTETERDRSAERLDGERAIADREHLAKQIEQSRLAEQETTRLIAQIRTVLTDLPQKPLRWADAIECLHQLSCSAEDAIISYDLTEHTGWARLDTAEQNALMESSVAYLRAHRPDADRSIGLGAGHPVYAPDWFGVQALASLAQHRPDALASLDRADWEMWAPAVATAPVLKHDDVGSPRQALIQLAPPHGRQALARAAVDHLRARAVINDDYLHPREVFVALTGDIADDVIDLFRSCELVGPVGAELLTMIGERIPDVVANDDLVDELSRSPDDAIRTAAFRLRASLDPDETMRDIVAGRLTGEALSEAAGNFRTSGVGDEVLRIGAAYMLDNWPYSKEPPLNSPGWRAGRSPRDLRDILVRELAERGDVEALTALAQRPGIDGRVIARYRGEAADRAAQRAVTPVSPTELLAVLAHSDIRLVRDEAGLVAALITFLDHLQHRLAYEDEYRDVWDGDKPKSEDDITDWVKRRIKESLPPRVVPDRELQVMRRRPTGSGDRTDLTVTIASGERPIRTVVEAKTINNPGVPTALREQLVERYLRPLGLHHGIYLVYWVRPDRRPPGWNQSRGADRDTFLQELRAQADAVRADGFDVVPYILDISPPPT